MSSVEEQVRGIVAEQLGLKADEIKNDETIDNIIKATKFKFFIAIIEDVDNQFTLISTNYPL